MPDLTGSPMVRPEAPLAHRLCRLGAGEVSRNFHALPLAGALRSMPDYWLQRFDFLRRPITATDVSYAYPALDSFFAPDGPLAEAQDSAARAFGAQAALFGSCGTTVSNRIVLDALGGFGAHALIDGASHQSIPFAAGGLGINSVVIDPLAVGGCKIPDLARIVKTLAAAHQSGRPFDLVVLTASSYDGYVVRMDEVLPQLIRASPRTAIMIDAAWGAIHSFSDALRPHTALTAIAELRETESLDLPPIVVTVSAHKSICSLRQGALILVANDADSLDSLKTAQFKHHTTSPSWPVLASVDLACAHAADLGAKGASRAINLRDRFVHIIQKDPLLRPLMPDDPDQFSSFRGLMQDPMKVAISLGPLGEPGLVRHNLYHEYATYVARCNGTGLLLHFTIGIDEADIDSLVAALREMVKRNCRMRPTPGDLAVGSIIEEYVVPYPPGIPIARPGDVWTNAHASDLSNEMALGAEIFRLPEPVLDRSLP
ncbi:MAG: hypothetical protein LBK59_10885 [Bifidobacteriaceae bacterium]|nr:hypothetical protein [Bifidobacteriaceae bacterium]